ncbi:hypothetical protein [Streptomyces sp. NPDC014734]|uniref:hypothetical protein n=1 Tax=Streptomyces sp. NPDC014734 TaxID=3364886 RepID=UPI0036F534FC
MACACKNKNNRHEVVQNGKVVYQGNKATAQAVAKRYPGSEVRPVGNTGAKAQ